MFCRLLQPVTYCILKLLVPHHGTWHSRQGSEQRITANKRRNKGGEKWEKLFSSRNTQILCKLTCNQSKGDGLIISPTEALSAVYLPIPVGWILPHAAPTLSYILNLLNNNIFNYSNWKTLNRLNDRVSMSGVSNLRWKMIIYLNPERW